MALLHWTNDKECNKISNYYIIGNLFGYPDKDIEAMQYYNALPENWNNLSEEKKIELWHMKKTCNIIKKIHKKFIKDKKKHTLKLKDFLNSHYLDKWIQKMKSDGSILSVTP